jgi:hypothetical protein
MTPWALSEIVLLPEKFVQVLVKSINLTKLNFSSHPYIYYLRYILIRFDVKRYTKVFRVISMLLQYYINFYYFNEPLFRL